MMIFKPIPTASILVLVASLAAACGGSTEESDGTAGGSQGGSAGSSGAAGTAGSAGTAGAAGTSGSAGAAGTAGAAGSHLPADHRPSGSTCPSTRDPGYVDSICGEPQSTWMCKSDADCTEGKNGRCFGQVGGAGCMGTFCSYDQCTEDKDCPSGIPCQCRSSTSNGANVCMTGSNCQVDADCGDGGYCSPSGVSNCSMAWFCHTAQDTCIDDTDCAQGGNESECSFDTTAKRWRCGQSTCLPVP